MDLTQLKTQIMTMFMVKSQSSTNDYSSIFIMLYTMIVMNLIEKMFQAAPVIWTQGLNLAKQYIVKKTHEKIPFVPVTKEKEEVYCITMKRNYDQSTSDSSNKCIERIDAVIEYLCNLNNSKHILLDRRFMLNTKEEIIVTPNIKASMHSITYNDKGEIGSIELSIYSTKLQIHDLRSWIDNIHKEYCYEKNNKLGNKKFFFNEVPIEPQRRSSGYNENGKEMYSYNWTTSPKFFTYSMNEFHTSKSFSNVFGSHVQELKERLDLFINHPEWYDQRGIPHSLGILLHGIPGAGKTSTIKAIARDTNRHIFNISLRPYTSQKQMMNLFFNENVVVASDGTNPITYNIPLHQRIYVIEDIDCLSNVVYDRSIQKQSQINEDGDAITLSFLLNLLDGVLETPGRILIITSNYPERLDSALVRPGRIDVKISFEFASRDLIAEIMNNFYSIEIEKGEIPEMLETQMSPAEVLESLCTNFKDWRAAIDHMVRKVERIKQKATIQTVSSLSTSQRESICCENTEDVGTLLEDLERDDGSGLNSFYVSSNSLQSMMESMLIHKSENQMNGLLPTPI